MTRRRTRPHRPSAPRHRLSAQRRLALGAAVVASIGLTAVGVAGADRRQPAPTEAERQVQREIDAMIDSGVPADDPKVEMLEHQVDDLRRSTRANPSKEPGVDLGQRVADAKAARRSRRRRSGRRRRPRPGSPAGVAERDRRVRAGTADPDGRGGRGCDLPQRSAARRLHPLCRRRPRRRCPHRRLRPRRQGRSRPGPLGAGRRGARGDRDQAHRCRRHPGDGQRAGARHRGSRLAGQGVGAAVPAEWHGCSSTPAPAWPSARWSASPSSASVPVAPRSPESRWSPPASSSW